MEDLIRSAPTTSIYSAREVPQDSAAVDEKCSYSDSKADGGCCANKVMFYCINSSLNTNFI